MSDYFERLAIRGVGDAAGVIAAPPRDTAAPGSEHEVELDAAVESAQSVAEPVALESPVVTEAASPIIADIQSVATPVVVQPPGETPAPLRAENPRATVPPIAMPRADEPRASEPASVSPDPSAVAAATRVVEERMADREINPVAEPRARVIAVAPGTPSETRPVEAIVQPVSDVRDVAAMSAPAELQVPLPSPRGEEAAEPLPDAAPARPVSLDAVVPRATPAIPFIHPPLDQAGPASSGAPPEEEIAIEVRIGRLEVRPPAPPPASPTSQPAAYPSGFAEYERARNYRDREWY